MRLAGALAVLPLRLLLLTCRIRFVEGKERLDGLVAAGEPLLLATWHHQLLGVGEPIYRRMVWRGHRLAAFVSLSRDGELLTAVARLHGVRVVRGSTSRGGLAGLLALRREMAREGSSVFLAPDGPRGPAGRAQPGALMLARLTGAPILPLGGAASRSWRVRSWDRLVVPKPFAKLAVTVGEPLTIPREADESEIARACCDLEARLHDLDRRAASALAR